MTGEKPNLLQITLGAGATQISLTSMLVNQVTFQNNAGHSCRLGDATVSATKGLLLASGSPGGSANFGPFSVNNADLTEWYIFGTAGDVIDILWF